MRNSAAFLGSCLTFALVACASTPPPEAATPAAPGEPAPPAPPPPAPDPAPAAASAEPPAAAPAEPSESASAATKAPAAPKKSAAPKAHAAKPAAPKQAVAAKEAAPTEPAAKEAAAKEAVPSGAPGPNDCKLAVKGDSPVAKACREGGAKQAKAVMKELIAKAKANGAKFRCDDCHKDPQDITKLTDDARKKFDQLVAAAK